jgi:beta-lysine 5,6-aminomutase beta subunit
MIVRPYGDTENDGAVQLSFTLPVQCSAKGDEAARQFVTKLGFEKAEIVHSQPASPGFTFFVAYGRTSVAVDLDTIEVVETETAWSFDEINRIISERIGRKIVVVGACTGFDAHTVGIDAIMNMKVYNHHYGLERYPMIDAYNMGAQVPNERLIEEALSRNADAILVSQVVTQKNTHVENLTAFVELLTAGGNRGRFIIVAGGPRIDGRFALELGFDAGFGRGTYAEDVATFVVKRLLGE